GRGARPVRGLAVTDLEAQPPVVGLLVPVARQANMTPEERAVATVFTSGEHCPMCAAAHGWVGLGRIVYVSSSEQLASWLSELKVPMPPVRPLPIQEIVPGLAVEGPIPGLAEQVRDLHRRFHGAP
ncbi:hypothetical protein AB0C54_35500, partial [Streptomyces sp. NPDC048611]